MKFVVVSERGEGLPIAMRLAGEGYSAKLLCLDESKIGEGLVEVLQLKTKGWRLDQVLKNNVPKDTMVVFTHGVWGGVAENLAQAGYLTFGGSSVHAALTVDPGYAVALNRLHEINTTPSELGGACAIEAWFNGEDFIYPIFGLFPEYGFMAGDVGVPIECAGVTGFAFKNFNPPRFRATLEKLRPSLKKVDYKGPISVDVVGGAVIRYVAGFRFDFIYLFMEMIHQPFGQLLVDVARGMVKNIKVRYEYGMCVRATMAPFPHSLSEPSELVVGQEHQLKDGLIPTGLSCKDGYLHMASLNGEAFCVSDFGSTIKEAQQNVFARVGKAMVPGLQFRIDIGALALRNIGALLQEK